MAKPTEQELARAAFVALAHAAWLRYLTHLEGAEVRAEIHHEQAPSRNWKIQAARDAFRVTASMLPAADPFRVALESYAEEEIAKMVDEGTPPKPPATLWT